ncbi:MAG TPA: amidohydrolase family protein, partial [Acidimicrobiales bacterium]
MLRNQPEFVYAFAAHSQLEIEVAWNTCSTAWARPIFGLLCVRAYNDWMVDDWCAPSGGRLIPLIIVPLWDADLAAQEVRRNADRDVRAVCFSEIPP